MFILYNYIKHTIMEKIIKRDGKIYLVKKDLAYGVWHTTETLIGEYDEEKPKEVKGKKTKKEDK